MRTVNIHGSAPRRRQWLKILGWTGLGLLGLLIIGGFIGYSMRGKLLAWGLDKVKAKVERDFNAQLEIGKAQTVGWSGAGLSGITLSKGGQQILRLDTAFASVRFWAMVRGDLSIASTYLADGHVDLDLLQTLRTADTTAPEVVDTTITAAGKLRRYLSTAVDLSQRLPRHCRMKNLSLSERDSSGLATTLTLDSFAFNAPALSSFIRLNRGDFNQGWQVDGSIFPDEPKGTLVIQTPDTGLISISLIRKLAGGEVGFSKVELSLDELDDGQEMSRIKGSVAATDFRLYNPRFSDDTVLVHQGGMQFIAALTDSGFSLNQGSALKLNALEAPITASFKGTYPREITAHLQTLEVSAQSFINSLPEGSFQSVKGMEIEGKLSYSFDFFLDLDNKDTVWFDSDMEGKDLRITKYGQADLTMLNTPFAYTPYNSPRKIIVGPQNPNFVPLSQISPYVREGVNISEDGNFFGHKGFNEESIRRSILYNLRSEEFSRGGSTISMQLVKNVFLTHKKTIERKLEEALLVWLLENLRVSSKSRMLETYLNVIEWGPNIYGIGEASRFYFNRHPSELTLNQGIFLAMLVPQPLAFSYRFGPDGRLKDYTMGYFRLIGGKMLARGLISHGQYDSLSNNVILTGPAHGYLRITQSPEEDTISQQLEIEDQRFNLDLQGRMKALFGRKDTVKSAEPESRKDRRQERRERRRGRNTDGD